MLFGFLTPNAGSVTVQEENILGLPQQKLRSKGISLVPEDRMLYGIAASASIEENLISDRSAEKRLNHGPLFNMKAIHEEADRLIEDYTVLCKSRKQQVGMLSGGNIQKVVVAREFSGDPVLILADQPTRGIDVGATEFIRKKLVELSRSGIAVLLISALLTAAYLFPPLCRAFFPGQDFPAQSRVREPLLLVLSLALFAAASLILGLLSGITVPVMEHITGSIL